MLVFGIISIAAIVTFTAWFWVAHAQAIIDRSVQQFGMALAQALARGGAEALTNSGSLETLKFYILTECGKTPALAYVAYCDREGHVLLDSPSLPFPHNVHSTQEQIFPIYREPLQNYTVPGTYLSPPGYRSVTNIAVPMLRNNLQMGICWVGLDNNAFTILGTTQETRNFLISVFALIGVLGAIGVWANYALINRPLKVLAQGASNIASGHFDYQIQSQRAGREIDQVVNAFNYMSARLAEYNQQNVGQLKSERNKYVSERNKLELVLMSIADGVVVCGADNRVQIVNAAATAIFAKDAKDIVGKPLVICTEGPDSPAICQIVQDFTDSLSPTTLEPKVQQMHLGEMTVRLHIAPIILNQEFLGSVMIMHDITRQTELEKMKNEFISNVSHELRTPITSIKSYVDTLYNHGEKLEADIYREFLLTIDNEAERLISLVNDVLELSRIEEGDLELERHALSLKQAAEAALRAVNLLAKDKQIDLTLNAIEPLPMVMMNEESMERVIINLLTNAIKYTPVGGRIIVKIDHHKKTIGADDLGARLAEPGLDDEVAVSVSDNGIGIPDDALPQIFDRFYRVERKVHTIKGTGLGLTIAKRIVEQHNGRIIVESALGQGSTFTVYLPVATVPADDTNPTEAVKSA